MAEKSKLYITISDKRGEGGGGGVDSEKEKEKENDTLGRYAEHEVFHFLKSTASKTINYSISNIGNFTGDYITQRKVNMCKDALDSAVSIGMTTLVGSKYGPAGAVIGFVVGVASEFTGSIFEDISNRADNVKANYNIEQLRERVGLNTLIDGSRGTEN